LVFRLISDSDFPLNSTNEQYNQTAHRLPQGYPGKLDSKLPHEIWSAAPCHDSLHGKTRFRIQFVWVWSFTKDSLLP
jgi:hypothetical protein